MGRAFDKGHYVDKYKSVESDIRFPFNACGVNPIEFGSPPLLRRADQRQRYCPSWEKC